MIDQFDRYIDSLGKLDDSDLYLDIDETMQRREEDRPTVDNSRSYTPHKK
jgi:hypothetical protein